MGLLFYLAMLISTGLLGLLIVFSLYRHPLYILTIVILFFMLDVLWGQSPPQINVSFINLYPLDLLTGLLLLAGPLRLLKQGSWIRLPYLMLVIFVGIVLAQMIAGINSFGLEQAGNSVRPYAYFLSVALFVSTLPFSLDLFNRFIRLWGWAALALTIIALLRWSLVSLGLASSVTWAAASGENVRVLNAGQTFLLLEAMVLGWYAQRWGWPMPTGRFLPVVLLPMVVLLQHRTVWVVLLVIFLLLLLREGRLRRRLLRTLAMAGIVGGILGLSFFGDSVPGMLQTSAGSTATFEWRVEGWHALLLQRLQEPTALLAGQPFGTGYHRLIAGREVDVSPHNYYVQVLLDTGGLGLALFLTIYGLLLFVLYRYPPECGPQRIVFILLVAHLVYFIPYSPSFEQGVVMGLAMGMYRLVRVRVRRSW